MELKLSQGIVQVCGVHHNTWLRLAKIGKANLYQMHTDVHFAMALL